MARATGRSTASRKIDEKIAELGDWRGERLSEVRRLNLETLPSSNGNGWGRPFPPRGAFV